MKYIVIKLIRKREKVQERICYMSDGRSMLCRIVPYYIKEEKLAEKLTNREEEVEKLKNKIRNSDFPLSYFKWEYLI